MSREAMKLALEALEANQPVNYCMNNNGEKFPMMQQDPFKFERNSKAITALREALAEQQQEPVTWMEMVVANLVREGVNKHKARELAQHFYTSPPAQRTWVGLTPEELDEMFSKTLKGKKLVNWVARAIEAKLKEKNNG